MLFHCRLPENGFGAPGSHPFQVNDPWTLVGEEVKKDTVVLWICSPSGVVYALSMCLEAFQNGLAPLNLMGSPTPPATPLSELGCCCLHVRVRGEAVAATGNVVKLYKKPDVRPPDDPSCALLLSPAVRQLDDVSNLGDGDLRGMSIQSVKGGKGQVYILTESSVRLTSLYDFKMASSIVTLPREAADSAGGRTFSSVVEMERRVVATGFGVQQPCGGGALVCDMRQGAVTHELQSPSPVVDMAALEGRYLTAICRNADASSTLLAWDIRYGLTPVCQWEGASHLLCKPLATGGEWGCPQWKILSVTADGEIGLRDPMLPRGESTIPLFDTRSRSQTRLVGVALLDSLGTVVTLDAEGCLSAWPLSVRGPPTMPDASAATFLPVDCQASPLYQGMADSSTCRFSPALTSLSDGSGAAGSPLSDIGEAGTGKVDTSVASFGLSPVMTYGTFFHGPSPYSPAMHPSGDLPAYSNRSDQPSGSPWPPLDSRISQLPGNPSPVPMELPVASLRYFPPTRVEEIRTSILYDRNHSNAIADEILVFRGSSSTSQNQSPTEIQSPPLLTGQLGSPRSTPSPIEKRDNKPYNDNRRGTSHRSSRSPAKRTNFPYNKTNYPGIENGTGVDYVLPFVHLLYFVSCIRSAAVRHICDAEHCLLCELGFLFHMLDLAWREGLGFPVQPFNFIRTLRLTREARALGLLPDTEIRLGFSDSLDESVPAGRSVAAVKATVRGALFMQFLCDNLHASFLEAKAPSGGTAGECGRSAVEEAFGASRQFLMVCDRGHKQSSPDAVVFIWPLDYKTPTEEPPPTGKFCSMLSATLMSSYSRKGMCGECNRMTTLQYTKRVALWPKLLALNCETHIKDRLDVWRKSIRYLPSRIFINKRTGKVSEVLEDLLSPTHEETLNMDVVTDDEDCADIHTYDLLAVIFNVEGERANALDNRRMISRSSHPSLAPAEGHIALQICLPNKRPQGVWYQFNHFTVTKVGSSTVRDMTAEWKVPVTLIFAQGGANFFASSASLSALDEPPSRLMPPEKFLHSVNLAQQPGAGQNAFVNLVPEEIQQLLAGHGMKLALDAEFVEVEVSSTSHPPAETPKEMQDTRGQRIKSLARVSIVRGDPGPLKGICLMDHYIHHHHPPADYLTQYSGLVEGDLSPVTTKHFLTTKKDVYQKLRILVDWGCCFIGHGLRMDFSTLNIFVPSSQLIDTVEIFRRSRSRMISLKFLAAFFLGKLIQKYVHDSVEDALTALEVYEISEKLGAEGVLDEMIRECYESGFATSWDPTKLEWYFANKQAQSATRSQGELSSAGRSTPLSPEAPPFTPGRLLNSGDVSATGTVDATMEKLPAAVNYPPFYPTAMAVPLQPNSPAFSSHSTPQSSMSAAHFPPSEDGGYPVLPLLPPASVTARPFYHPIAGTNQQPDYQMGAPRLSIVSNSAPQLAIAGRAQLSVDAPPFMPRERMRSSPLLPSFSTPDGYAAERDQNNGASMHSVVRGSWMLGNQSDSAGSYTYPGTLRMMSSDVQRGMRKHRDDQHSYRRSSTSGRTVQRSATDAPSASHPVWSLDDFPPLDG